MDLITILSLLVVAVGATPSYDDIKVTYYGSSITETLNYTQTNASSSSSLSTTYFDPAKKTVVITFGWNIIPSDEGPRAIINAYLLRKSDWNVLYVDWSAFAKCMMAIDIVRRINPVANTTKKILQANTNFNASNVHFIGAGFGALIFGAVSRNIQNVSRLTALDSANFFNLLNIPYNMSKVVKVSAGDAKFVDTIHTNDDALGDAKVQGHVNFFPSGGKKQPGCNVTLQRAFNSFVNKTAFQLLTCSNQRAWRYYVESIGRTSSSQPFIAKECPSSAKTFTASTCTTTSTASMGFFADVSTTNRDRKISVNYFVDVNSASTFSKN